VINLYRFLQSIPVDYIIVLLCGIFVHTAESTFGTLLVRKLRVCIEIQLEFITPWIPEKLFV